jgi:hypothetical protein
MSPSNDKNLSSGSQKTEDPKQYHRNLSPGSYDHKALAVVQDLSWGSLFPLFAVYIKHGPLLVYYLRTSRGGLRLCSILSFLKIIIATPIEINDLHYTSTTHVNYWNTQHLVVNACNKQFDRIEYLINKHLPKCTSYMKKLLASNVNKAWQTWLLEASFLEATAQLLGKQENVIGDRVFLISRYAYLLKTHKIVSSADSKVFIHPQLNQNKAVLFPLAAIGLSFFGVCRSLFSFRFSAKKSNPTNPPNLFKIGLAAAWGIEGTDKSEKDDLHWWRNSSINANRLIYMFEREDIQPTRSRIKQAENLGIQSVDLKPKFTGDFPNLLVKNNETLSVLKSFQNFCFQLKLASKIIFSDRFTQAVLALVSWQFYNGNKLANVYKKLNLKGVFHFEEGGMDFISLASFMNNSIRFGTHWASHTGINYTSVRNHQVYFLWGNHDKKFALDSGSTSQTLLLAGCFLSNHSHKEEHQKARERLNIIRKKGVRYILTLLDNSLPCPEFYRFFLQWLEEDPYLGLLIKSKGQSWKNVQDDGLDGLVEHAINSNRLYEMDSSASPVDAAILTDFAVGITSITALVAAALNGSRIIFLDYEQVDQGPQNPYCTLHSLGSNRCVFYEPSLLRKAIINYFKNPDSNPTLGDATPVLDQFDPFRDGKASQRIGEFVGWYLEELDGGSNPDKAVRSSTERYAKKWGQDKVIRRI